MGSFSNSGAGDAFDSSNRAKGADSQAAKDLEKKIAESAAATKEAAERARGDDK